MGMPVQHYYTAADLLDFPEDGNKYEVVHGELLVSPSPRRLHQRLVVGSLLALERTSRPTARRGLPRRRRPSGEDSLVIPDLLVVDLGGRPAADWQLRSPPRCWSSRSSVRRARDEDRFTKRRLYQEVGIPLYWLVDADAGRWRCGPRRCSSLPSSTGGLPGTPPGRRSRW